MSNFKLSEPIKSGGFTLIELLIAIVIITVLSTVGIASFNGISRSNAIQQQAQEVKTLARKLRTDASAAVKPSGSCTTTPGTIEGTYIYFKHDASSYWYGTGCFDSAGTSLVPANKKDLPSNSRFDINAGGDNFLAILYTFNGQVITYTFNLAVGDPTIQRIDYDPSIGMDAGNPTPLRIEYIDNSSPYFVYFNGTGLVCEQRVNPSTCAQ